LQLGDYGNFWKNNAISKKTSNNNNFAKAFRSQIRKKQKATPNEQIFKNNSND
jgi:hypothetical protein